MSEEVHEAIETLNKYVTSLHDQPGGINNRVYNEMQEALVTLLIECCDHSEIRRNLDHDTGMLLAPTCNHCDVELPTIEGWKPPIALTPDPLSCPAVHWNGTDLMGCLYEKNHAGPHNATGYFWT